MIWFQCIHQEQRKRQILPPTKKTKKRPKPEESDVSDSINKKKRPADTKSDIDSKSHSTAEDNSNVENNGNINSAPDNAICWDTLSVTILFVRSCIDSIIMEDLRKILFGIFGWIAHNAHDDNF